MTAETSEIERQALIDHLGDLEDSLNEANESGRDPSFIEGLHEEITAVRRKLRES